MHWRKTRQSSCQERRTPAAHGYHRGMFSYRHAFHAGNHADVLKHAVLIATLQYLTEKDAALTVLDTHAGAGLYRLDGDYARTSGEASEGILKLTAADAPGAALVPMLQEYVDTVRAFNQGSGTKVYPGSPFIIQRLLRAHDKLKLFELHPTDLRALAGNVAQLDAGRQVAVLHEDGFEGIKKFLPPPARRALVLCDPSYEMKSDYGKVLDMVQDALKRFATGTYAVWYPIIPRPEAHDLPPQDHGPEGRQELAARHAHGEIEQDHGKRPGPDQAPRPARQWHVPHQPTAHAQGRAPSGAATDGGATGSGSQRHPHAGGGRLSGAAPRAPRQVRRLSACSVR